MTWFQLLTENASPVELMILAWISWRVEGLIVKQKASDEHVYNVETKVNALWKIWGHLTEKKVESK